MRKLYSALLLGAAFAFLGGPAHAAPIPRFGTITLLLGTLSPVTIPGGGVFDPATGAISATFFGPGAGSSPVTGNAPITQIFFSVTGNAAGIIGTGPSVGGTLQARGFGIGAALAGAPLTGNIGFPSATTMVHSAASATVSAHFGKWIGGHHATKVAAVTRTHTGMTGTCGAGPGMTGPACPAGALGTATWKGLNGVPNAIVYIAPTDLYSSLAGGIPTFTVITLVPEPGTLLLLGSGVAGLALLGRKRRTRS